MPDRSMRVVYYALAGNTLVMMTKFAAAFVSGSAAMTTEAIHSTTDVLNQTVLIIGNRRSRQAPDATHNFGYGMEIYYWTFVIAMMVLIAGGVGSLYFGWLRFRSPMPITSPGVGLAVLTLSFVFEGGSFAVGYREYKRMAAAHVIPGSHVGLLTFIKLSKDPNLYETLLEDGAALIGIAIAAIGLMVSAYLGFPWADGAASMLIGLLLIANSAAILAATKSLMGGEAVAPPLLRDITSAIADYCGKLQVNEIKTLHLGPRDIVISLSIAAQPTSKAATVRDQLRRLRKHLKSVDARIRHVLVDVK